MYMYKNTSKTNAMELTQMSEKIRDIKYEISMKCNKLKVLRLNKQEEKEEEFDLRPKGPSVGVPLVELKKGTEVLER